MPNASGSSLPLQKRQSLTKIYVNPKSYMTNSEFSSLNDIALSRGILHSDLIVAIHEAVLTEYFASLPSANKNTSVVVDEKTGNVRLILGTRDVTPPKLA